MSKFPHGSCVKTEKGFWFINGRFRNRLATRRVFKSWSFPLIINSSEKEMSGIPTAWPLGFRDGTLIRNIKDNNIYLISARKRRLASRDALSRFGLKEKDAMWVSNEETSLHAEGDAL